MKFLMVAASAVALAAAGAPAVAQDTGIYASAGYAATDRDDASLGAIQGRIGARLMPFLGVEGEGAIGVKSDDVNIAGTPVEVELNHQLAAYAVGFIPVSQNLDIIGRVGFGTSEIEASAGGTSVEADGESVNYGVGAQYFFTGADGVRADWTRHDFTDDDGGEIDVWSVSYVRKF